MVDRGVIVFFKVADGDSVPAVTIRQYDGSGNPAVIGSAATADIKFLGESGDRLNGVTVDPGTSESAVVFDPLVPKVWVPA